MRKVLGILGGGQLGMMSAQAADKIGVDTIIYTPEENSPASRLAKKTFVGAYDDFDQLKVFAKEVDYISYEFENIPVKTIQFLRKYKPVAPDDSLLRITQDRVQEKKFLNNIGIETAKWAEIVSEDDIRIALDHWGMEKAVLKTTRFGYDGKGQEVIQAPEDIKPAWEILSGNALILESFVDYLCEISVIVARDIDGNTITYEPSHNLHKNGILSRSMSPSGLASEIIHRAKDMAVSLAKSVDLQGVLALEMFVTKDGNLLANEIAPRPHNSGHWTIEACEVSQFENHVRSVCGMDVLPPKQKSSAEMINLIGHDISDLEDYLNNEKATIHDYGKGDIRAGRKMGHVTIIKPF